MLTETMERLGSFCKSWGVKSWRIAGDSEPTLNPNLGVLLQSGHDNGIAMGLITNGVLLDKVKNLQYLTWLGISLDAVTFETWHKLKHGRYEEWGRLFFNIEDIRRGIPNLDITLKFIRWDSSLHLGRVDFDLDEHPIQANNYGDAELLPELARRLGVNYAIRDALPKGMSRHYTFDRCRATPLYGTFGTDHRFYLCCDRRDNYVLTNDYTRDDWQELPKVWGGQKHLDLIKSIIPQSCKFCSKEWLNTIFESVILDGKETPRYQVEFV